VIRVVLSLLLLATSAGAWDSRCYKAGVDCAPGPESARNRWIGPSDEHRALYEATRVLAGLPAAASAPFTLDTFTGDDPVNLNGQPAKSFAPVDFGGAMHVTPRTTTAGEFAQLPDFSYALWDWVTGNEQCPLGPIPAQDCHDFATHMGPVNSNHFPPQSQIFYTYYHALAMFRADACKTMQTRLGSEAPRFTDFLRACEDEALVLEATGQHFLQDAWSSGHMWERWGSPDLGDFPDDTTAIMVAITSGLIHGARAVLEDLPHSHPDISAALAVAGFDLTQYDFDDQMCAPHPDVQWVGPLDPTPQPGFGDLYLPDATGFLSAQGGATFSEQHRGLFSCAVAGLRAVYLAAGEQHGQANPPAGALLSLDPTSADCFGQRATNRAMLRGIGIDFVDAHGVAQRLELDGTIAAWLVPALSTVAGGSPTPARVNDFIIDIADVVFTAKTVTAIVPDGIHLAAGTLGPFLGVDVNHAYVKNPIATYVDPPLPWAGPTIGGGPLDPKAVPLGRAFHRAHAIDWCNAFHRGDPNHVDVESLASRVDMLMNAGVTGDELTTACAVCGEFTARALRVGTDANDYDAAREPLCRLIANTPAAAQIVYQPGQPGDAVDLLAAQHCGCATTTTSTSTTVTTSTVPQSFVSFAWSGGIGGTQMATVPECLPEKHVGAFITFTGGFEGGTIVVIGSGFDLSPRELRGPSADGISFHVESDEAQDEVREKLDIAGHVNGDGTYEIDSGHLRAFAGGGVCNRQDFHIYNVYDFKGAGGVLTTRIP